MFFGVFFFRNKKNINELGHKTYNKTCATSKDSDQPAHLQPPGYPKRNKQEPLSYWVDLQADLHLSCSQMSNRRFCRALAQMHCS